MQRNKRNAKKENVLLNEFCYRQSFLLVWQYLCLFYFQGKNDATFIILWSLYKRHAKHLYLLY